MNMLSVSKMLIKPNDAPPLAGTLVAIFSKLPWLLTHCPRVTYICVSGLDQHGLSQCLVGCSAPSHYLNQYCLIVNWTLTMLESKYENYTEDNVYLKISSAKCPSFCLGYTGLTGSNRVLMIRRHWSKWLTGSLDTPKISVRFSKDCDLHTATKSMILLTVYYSALPIYRGLFSPNSSQETPISRPLAV